MSSYYDDNDLNSVNDIGEDAHPLWQRFRSWYTDVFSDGALTHREKSLVALAVAHALQCPYSIDTYSEECLERGYSMAQMTEAVHVTASLRAGSSLMHALQMRNTAGRLRDG